MSQGLNSSPSPPSREPSYFETVKNLITVQAVSMTMRAPFKRIETILRTQHVNPQLDLSFPLFKGGINCLIRLPRQQGILSFWRGNMMNIFSSAVTLLFTNTLYPIIKKSRIVFSEDDHKKEGLSLLLTGAVSGFLSVLASFPFHLATVKLQADCSGNHVQPQFKSLPDLFDTIYRVDGLTGFYRAYGISLIGILVYRGVFFSLAGLIALRESDPTKIPFSFFLNSWVVFLAGTISYPCLLLKERTQVQLGWEDSKKNFKTVRGCLRYTFEKEGFRGLYRGYPFTMAVSVVGSILLSLPLRDMIKRDRKQ